MAYEIQALLGQLVHERCYWMTCYANLTALSNIGLDYCRCVSCHLAFLLGVTELKNVSAGREITVVFGLSNFPFFQIFFKK